MSNVSTQSHLDIEDIRNDLVILKNGNVVLVLETTALNFDLLSDEEQDARIVGFANLMNSLTFTIQIVIHNERTDVTKYIERLRYIQSKQTAESVIRQMEIYIRFIKNLITNSEVIDKRFLIVIPAFIAAIQRPSLLRSVFGGPSQVTIDIDRILSKAQLELYPKRDQVIKQIKKIGLGIRQLSTDELIQLYYSMYDPDKTGYRQMQIGKSDYTVPIIVPRRVKTKKSEDSTPIPEDVKDDLPNQTDHKEQNTLELPPVE